MENKQSFLPINNHYSTIDLSTLSAPSNKVGTSPKKGQIKGIGLSTILPIEKYSKQLLNNSQSKESLILESKKVEIKEIKETPSKSSYFDKIDMLNVPQSSKAPKENDFQTIIQKYLKSFTTLDIELAQNQSILYEFNSKTLNSKILNNNVSKILEYSFFEMSSVISRPSFYVSPNKVIINLFYFVVKKNSASFHSHSTINVEGNDNDSLMLKKNFLPLNLLKLQDLSNKLSYYFNKPIILELTQLYSISNNSQILAHFLGKLGLSRKRSFPRIINRFLKHQSKKIFFRNKLNKLSRFGTLLTGVYIKLGGRLMRGKIVPRRTVKKIQYGSLARCKSNYITNARYTQKNKRGSFSFTVSIGHKFF